MMANETTVVVNKKSTIDIPIDYSKYIVCGQDYLIGDKIHLHNPTIKEIIVDFGEEKYLQFVNLMVMRPYDDMVALDDAGLNYQDFTDYDVFLRNYKFITPEISSLVLGDINLTEFVLAVNNETEKLILVNESTGVIIDELVYSYMASYIRRINFISSKVEYDVGNEITRRYLIKKKRKELKKRKKNPKKSTSFLANIISLLCSSEGCKYNYQTILDMKISQLYDNYYRINVIDERNRYLNILCSGMVKSENKDSSKLNWTKDLMEE